LYQHRQIVLIYNFCSSENDDNDDDDDDDECQPHYTLRNRGKYNVDNLIQIIINHVSKMIVLSRNLRRVQATELN